MTPSEVQEYTTNQLLLEGILATLNRVELLLSRQNHPRPSGLSDDVTLNFEYEERHGARGDIGENENHRQCADGEDGENLVDDGHQKDENEADDAN